MSTILNALKKIESQKRRERPERGLLEQVARGEYESPPLAEPRPWRKGVWLVLLCLAVSGSTALLARHLSRHDSEEQLPASVATSPESEQFPLGDTEETGQRAWESTVDRERQEATSAERRMAHTLPQRESDRWVVIDEDQEDLSDPATTLEEKPRPRLWSVDSTSAAPAPAPDLKLKVDAIVWSPDPTSRFAMVNLKSVREGDVVNGAAVVEIAPDWIVFEYRGDQFEIVIKK